MSNKRRLIFAVLVIIFLTTPAIVYLYNLNRELDREITMLSLKGGTLTQDETWSGEILVTERVTVPEGVALTIESGTVIKFKHYRGYKEPWKGTGLGVAGGTIKAIGTPTKQIWFTSDAEEPINGDWGGIEIVNSSDSIIKYAIVEYAVLGVSQMESQATISHSIIRWSNSEGLYAERSTPTFEYNTLYSNGYHEIALEQYNTNAVIRNNVFSNGRAAIHTEETSATVENNYFLDYLDEAISAQAESTMQVNNNTFINTPQGALIVDKGSTMTLNNNSFVDSSHTPPPFDYEDIKDRELDYIPGDPEDQYLYIYDDVDETRRTIKKIGEGLGFGWAITYANNYVWRFSFSNQIGECPDFIRINPDTEETTRYRNDIIINPRGLTYDGDYFWTNDFSGLKIYQFSYGEDSIEIISFFDVPDKEDGGTNGLTTDGTYLYYHSRDGSKLYKLDKSGNIVETTNLISIGITMEGPLVWTGDGFWATGGIGIVRYNTNWEEVSSIYPPAVGVWAIDWDGTYLWTIQRTCERWDDPKIYQIEILDDSLD
ncbi:MAG: right-handed parallel beta-helix repeat-containing protein [Nanoarchaeota archaeon]|nr:right-handed parallel beta-helix repeat-containing protein [Nanoarchaeota archaeon]